MNHKWYEDAREALTEFQKWSTNYQKQQAQAREAEQKRRAALTPAQRAAQDRAKTEKAARLERQKLAREFAKIGDVIRKADTWTIADFCWLLLAENPAADSWSFFDGRSDKAAKQHREYCAVIESCVHTRLKPVNPIDTRESHRFTAQSLIQVACDKHLGYADVLAEIVGFKSEPPAPQTEGRPRKSRTAWYDVLTDVLLQIERGAQRLGQPLRRKSLPGTAKQLLPIVREVCERRKITPPTKPDTVLNRMNKDRWGFGGPGVRQTTGEL